MIIVMTMMLMTMIMTMTTMTDLTEGMGFVFWVHSIVNNCSRNKFSFNSTFKYQIKQILVTYYDLINISTIDH